MQVIAPEFFAPFTGPSSARSEERPGDGLFDSLLREEEARYKESLPQLRERPNTEPPARDDVVRDERLPDERRDDEPLRDTRAQRDDRPAEDRDSRRAADATSDDTRRPAGETDDAPAGGDNVSLADGGEDAVETAPPAQAPRTKAGIGLPVAEVQPDGTAVNAQHPTQPVAAQAAVAAVETAMPVTARPTATTAATTTPPAATTTPNPVQGETAGAPATEAALPASAAAPAEKAAAHASATATAKPANPVAAEHRQSPTQATPAAGGEQSKPRATGNTTTLDADLVVETPDSLSSRPAAALGGGAATAAMAQAGRQTGSDRAAAQNAAADTAQPAAAQKSAAQPGAQAKVPEVALAAASDRAIQVSPALAGGNGGETAGNAGGQSGNLVTPLAASGGTSAASSQSTSFAETMANARNTPTANPAEQIAVQVRRAQVAGQEQINIKLHPAELGRIEVKLESNTDGTLRAVISAERSETLDLLQRDARGLERALQEAGVKTDSGSLNFSLRGQGQQQGQQADGGATPRSGGSDGASGEADALDLPAAEAQARQSSHDGALDIRV